MAYKWGDPHHLRYLGSHPPSVTLEATQEKKIPPRLDRLRAKCTWCEGLGVSGRASHRQAQGVGNLAGVGLLGWGLRASYLCQIFLVKNKHHRLFRELKDHPPPFCLKVMFIVQGVT